METPSASDHAHLHLLLRFNGVKFHYERAQLNTHERVNTMKHKAKILIITLGLGATALLVAQDAPRIGDGGRPPRGGPHHRPPPPAIIAALDANHDGIIDATEIANASALLMSLDKNGDGKLTPDEFMGPRPEGPGGPGGGPPPDGVEGPDAGSQPQRPPGE